MILNIVLIFFGLIHTAAITIFLIGLFKRIKLANKRQPFISVVIALKDEAENIKSLIDGLSQQDYPAHKYEIILVDNDSQDNTFEKITQASKNHKCFKALTTQNFSSEFKYKKEALLMGIENASGEIILSTDADCYVPRTWISAIAKCYEKDVDMVVGFSRVADERTIFDKFQAFDFMQLMAAAKGALNLGLYWAGSGQNLSFRKAAFFNSNGYKHLKTLKGGDDTLFIQKFAKMNDGRIIFAPFVDAGVKTRSVRRLSDFLRQRIRWASEASYTRNFNPVVFLISLGTFLMNISILFYLVSALWIPQHWLYLGFLTGLKFGTEFGLAIKASRVFGMRRLLKIFPLWFLLYPFYAVFLGIMSFQGQKIKWK